MTQALAVIAVLLFVLALAAMACVALVWGDIDTFFDGEDRS